VPTRLLSMISHRRSLCTPISVGVVLSLLVGVMWVAFDRNRTANLKDMLRSATDVQASLIAADIAARLPALRRIADQWHQGRNTTQSEFISEARAHIRDLPGFQALGWVDHNYIVRWIEPIKGNEEAENLNLAFETNRRVALETARKTRTPVMTAPIDLVQGGKGFLIYYPIFVDDQFNGLLSAVIRIESWLNYIFKSPDGNAKYHMAISIDNHPVYVRHDGADERYANWKVTSDIQMMNHRLAVDVIPTQAFFEANTSSLAEWAAGVGMLLAALATYMCHTILLLQKVVDERQRADDALRQAHENLEDLVVARTAELNEEIAERKRLEKRVRRSQRMEAVGQLTGGIAHDFNNLLGVMIGHAEILDILIGDNEKARGSIEALIKAVDRGAALTNRLLAFSRKQALSSRPTNIDELITGLLDMLKRTLGETVELRTDLSDDVHAVLIDSHQFENALVNLAINARDAMSHEGVLMIGAENVSLDAAYAAHHEEVTPGDYVKVSVRDTGSGMSPETREKVFEPFFTTKDVGQGSGLGLSMVYGFIKQSNGHATVESEPGHGTTVNLYLPRSQDPVANPMVTVDADPFVKGSERILVVEDDEDVRDVSVTILRTQGFKVVEATTGIEAVMRMTEDLPFDLLFTDVVLPGGMTGVGVANEAKRLYPNIKVVFTSGYDDNEVAHNNALTPGAFLIKKPYRRAELLTMLKTVLDDGGAGGYAND